MSWCDESVHAVAIGECGRGRKREQITWMEQVVQWMWVEAGIVMPGKRPVPFSGSADQSEMTTDHFDSP
jgi:hypothetical protein